jgi:hypothetical protein
MIYPKSGRQRGPWSVAVGKSVRSPTPHNPPFVFVESVLVGSHFQHGCMWTECETMIERTIRLDYVKNQREIVIRYM